MTRATRSATPRIFPISLRGRPALDRAVTVMLSIEHYERLKGAAWERRSATMDAMGQEASANGLAEAQLDALLADES